MTVNAGEVQYALHGESHVAFRMWGDGPPLLYVPSQFIPIAAIEEEPAYERFIARLSSFATVIVFDRQGIGLSDPMRERPTVEDWASQLEAVLDAASFDSSYLLAHAWGGLAAVTLTASRPERVRGLILAMAAGAPSRPIDASIEDVIATARPSAPSTAVDFLRLLAPTRADDVAFRRWWDSAGRRGASPAVAQQLLALHVAADVTHLIPKVRVSTLVIDRPEARPSLRGDVPFGVEIVDARLVEVDGNDVLVWLGDIDDLTAEIEDFVTGSRQPVTAERELLAVMFSDIVGSTERAARLGDRRWREALDAHDRLMRAELQRHSGTARNTAGDGWLSTFATPSAAARCAARLHRVMADIGIQLRIGIHCGEVERRGGNIAGIAVHLAARVEARATPGETWVTRTVKDAMDGSGFALGERGVHELKGISGAWELYALT